MSKKKALGQGLDALLGTDFKLNEDGASSTDSIQNISIERLKPNPDQPRQSFDQQALAELADSIRQQGVVQPLLAEERADGSYMLIAGERRWRASRLAGLSEVPVIVRRFSQEQKLEIALVENIQREDLTAMEEARAYHRLMELLDLSQQDIAVRVGKNRSTVANSLRLLKLPDRMKDAVEKGQLTAGHARSILAVTNPADQDLLFDRIIGQSLSVREAESMAADFNKGQKSSVKKTSVKAEQDPEILRIEQEFIEALGTKVSLRGNYSRGRVEISWFNREDLERIYEYLIKQR